MTSFLIVSGDDMPNMALLNGAGAEDGVKMVGPSWSCLQPVRRQNDQSDVSPLPKM